MTIRTVCTRVTIPPELHARLRHLAVDLGVSVGDLLNDGAAMLLRIHHGETLPAPTPPAVTAPAPVTEPTAPAPEDEVAKYIEDGTAKLKRKVIRERMKKTPASAPSASVGEDVRAILKNGGIDIETPPNPFVAP